MEDNAIIALYFARDESAITETDRKYRRYLSVIADNILSNCEDTEECISDTYFRAWNTIPPERPSFFGSYLGRLTRHLAVDRYRRKNAEKRKLTVYAQSLEELAECIGDEGAISPDFSEEERLSAFLDGFLRGLAVTERQAFLLRYYYSEPIGKIAGYLDASEAKIKSVLFRTRKKLREQLEGEEFLK